MPMTEQEIQTALSPLAGRLQVAFLAGSVEHVYPACAANDVVAHAIQLAWTYALTGNADDAGVAQVSAQLDGFVDEDTSTVLVHVASAAELVAKALRTPNRVVLQVLNNIEAAISVVDPEPDQGMVEERKWQERALAIIQQADEHALTRDAFGGISGKKPGWLERLESL